MYVVLSKNNFDVIRRMHVTQFEDIVSAIVSKVHTFVLKLWYARTFNPCCAESILETYKYFCIF